MAGTSIYSATKAAVNSLGRTLAVELAPRGVRVNVLSPGPIDTPLLKKVRLSPEQEKESVKTFVANSLLKRLEQPKKSLEQLDMKPKRNRIGY